MYYGNHDSILRRLEKTVSNLEEEKNVAIAKKKAVRSPSVLATFTASLREDIEVADLQWLCHALGGMYLESYINWWSFMNIGDYSDGDLFEMLNGLSLEKKYLIMPKLLLGREMLPGRVWYKHLKRIIWLRNNIIHDMPLKEIRDNGEVCDYIKMGREGSLKLKKTDVDYYGENLLKSVKVIIDELSIIK